jgi:hypothetical protein
VAADPAGIPCGALDRRFPALPFDRAEYWSAERWAIAAAANRGAPIAFAFIATGCRAALRAAGATG